MCVYRTVLEYQLKTGVNWRLASFKSYGSRVAHCAYAACAHKI